MTTALAPTRPPAPTAHGRPVTPGLLVVLALLSAVAPFATDLYLPAFPAMTQELATSPTSIQLTLTAFLVGLAAGQLVFGPVSDRIGRRVPLIAGAVLCVLASAVAATAPTVGVLIVARLVQGLAGAAGMVIGRAIISDLASGRAAARALSTMMVVGGLAPVVAPLAGGLLLGTMGWRGLLGLVLGLAVLMLVAVLAVVRETNPADRRAGRRALGADGGSAHALRSRAYLGSAIAFAFGFAVMMAYISASPFLYQVMMGLSEVQYGLLFGANAVGLAMVSALAARLADRYAVRGLLLTGLSLVLAGAVLTLVLALVPVPAGWIAVPVFVSVASLGLVLGNGTALALEAAPRQAGSASAVLGALQFGLAAAVSPLVSLGGETTAVPLGVVMVGAAAVALIAAGVAGATPGGGVARAVTRR